jgi:hypothetical protein
MEARCPQQREENAHTASRVAMTIG